MTIPAKPGGMRSPRGIRSGSGLGSSRMICADSSAKLVPSNGSDPEFRGVEHDLVKRFAERLDGERRASLEHLPFEVDPERDLVVADVEFEVAARIVGLRPRFPARGRKRLEERHFERRAAVDEHRVVQGIADRHSASQGGEAGIVGERLCGVKSAGGTTLRRGWGGLRAVARVVRADPRGTMEG